MSIFLVFFFLFNSSFSLPFAPQEKTAADLKKEGIELYHGGEYVRAIEVFKQIEGKTTDKYILSQAHIYLAMSYYCLEEREEATRWLNKAIATNPELTEADLLFPPGFDTLFSSAKAEAVKATPAKPAARPAAKPAAKPVVKAPATTKPPVVKASQKTGGKKKSKSTLFVVGGVAVVAGVLAAVFLGGGPKTGGLQLSSTPTGASVHLDGANTGEVTPCTLTDLTPGNHSLKLVKDGYNDYTANVSVTKGQTTPHSATLIKNVITVTAPAAGAAWLKGYQTAEITWSVSVGSLRQDQTGLADQTSGPNPEAARIQAQRLVGSRLSERSASMAGRQAVGDATSGVLSDTRRTMSAETGVARIERNFRPNVRTTVVDSGATVTAASPASSGGLAGLDPRLSTQTTVANMAIDNVKIELYKGASVVRTVVASTPNNGTYSWAVPVDLTDGTDYLVRISCTTDATVYGQSGAFTVSNASLAITAPTSTTVWDNGTTYTITWATNIPSTENVKIELFSGANLHTTISSSTPNDGSFSWAVPAYATVAQGTNYSIRITTLTSPAVSGQSAGGFIIAERNWTYVTSWGSLNNPHGVTMLSHWPRIINDSMPLAIAETGANRIVYLDPDDSSRTYTSDPLSGPRGISEVNVVTSSYPILQSHEDPVVADYGNASVKRFHGATSEYSTTLNGPTDVTNDGAYLYITYASTSINRRSHDLQTSYQYYYLGGNLVGIAWSSLHQSFFITDDSTNTVRVYNSTLSSQLRSWTLPGAPADIYVDSYGFVYVAVPGANRVQKYSYDGRLVIDMIWSSGYAPTGLYCPSTTMYVTVRNLSTPSGGSVQQYTW